MSEVTQEDRDAAERWGTGPVYNMQHLAEAFARHREAAEAASKSRTLSDHGRMLWRDDVEGHCPSPELCFEYGPTVRCSPCAIKQAEDAGVATLHPDRTYSPQECRLKRELAASKAREAALVEAGDLIRDRLLAFVSALALETDCGPDVDAITAWDTLLGRENKGRLGFARAAVTKEPDA